MTVVGSGRILMVRFLLAAALLAGAMLGTPVMAQSLDIARLAGTALGEIAAGIDEQGRTSLEAIAAAEPSAAGVEGLGMALLLKRQLDAGTWLYALALERDPANPSLMSSVGTLAQQLDDAGRPVAALDGVTRVELHRMALSLAPDDAAIKFNLASALLELGDEAFLDEALELLEEAVTADPNNGLYGSRLAEALLRAGREDEARDALNRAFINDPISIAVLLTNAGSFGGGAIQPPQRMCEIDFQCDRICPGGIIGRLNYVQCEIENASAVSSCQAGQPFPKGYDCDLQFPEFGILIPGLYPGLSIITPWGSIDFLVQGDGRVDYRVRIEGPSLGGVAGPSIEFEGSWQPSNGELRVQGSGGIGISLPSNDSRLLEQLNQTNYAPTLQLYFNPAPGPDGHQFEPSIEAFGGTIVG
jgi:tetratricopeptide (TPR) repeat protein